MRKEKKRKEKEKKNKYTVVKSKKERAYSMRGLSPVFIILAAENFKTPELKLIYTPKLKLTCNYTCVSSVVINTK